MNIAHSTSMEYRLVRRAQIICLANQGVALKDIEEAGYGQTRTIRTWIERYVQAPGIDSLRDKLRPGRPLVYDGPIKQKVIAFVCQYPDEWGLTELTLILWQKHWMLFAFMNSTAKTRIVLTFYALMNYLVCRRFNVNIRISPCFPERLNAENLSTSAMVPDAL